MKIVIATPILYDAKSPFNHLFKDIIGGFLDDGNQVVRLVAVRDQDETDYQYGYAGENIQYKLFKRRSSEHSNIISRYVRDTLTNIREAIGIFKLKNVDVLFEDVSYSSFWAVLAAKLKGIKVVAMLQDVWPDNAVQSNLIREGSVLYKYFEMWQRYVYKKADRIICISDDMKAFIATKGVDTRKIDVIYNWGYSDDIVDIAWDDNVFVKKYDLRKDMFYAVYAGNIGKMQNVEIVVKAAKELRDRKDIHFLIIGDGARKDVITEMAKGLDNVTILPMQPSEMATHIYSAAGVNIIPLVKGGTKTAMPSKTGVVLSCGQPVLFAFGTDSVFSMKVNDYSSGICVSSDESSDLAKQVLALKTAMPKKDYRMFNELFTRSKNLGRYITNLNILEKRI